MDDEFTTGGAEVEVIRTKLVDGMDLLELLERVLDGEELGEQGRVEEEDEAVEVALRGCVIGTAQLQLDALQHLQRPLGVWYSNNTVVNDADII